MSVSQMELESAVYKAVALYNRLRSPHAFIKVTCVTPTTLTITFSGSFCYNCAVPLSYIQDFAHNIKIFNSRITLKVDATRQISTNSFEADYSVIIQ